MTYVFALEDLGSLAPDEARILVGGKAANLALMVGQLGLPVPPAFAISTAACRAYLADGWPVGLDAELRERMAGVEAAARRRFGDPGDPLLVSVRSGAPISMPGMMDTILDLGLNDETAEGLGRASGDEAFARRCRERLEAAFRSIVGVDEVPADPWLQLRLAVEAVFRSWNGERARAYRQREGIADDLGTGVTIQTMVFGNRGPTSATGVLFTRNPATGEPHPYGDVLFDAQGEDVVAGTHATEPIAVLDERLPAIGAELRKHAGQLERHFRDLCDIEFTIEDGRLWLLQVRVGKRSPQAALRIAVDMAEDETFQLSRAEAVDRVRGLLARPPVASSARSGIVPPLVTGLPASPGLASGPIVTNPEAAVASAEAGRPAILVRAETSPDDVHGMSRAAGVLTSLGGLASHAAVVARGWGIPAVVGAGPLDVLDGRIRAGGRDLAAGDVITIDGATGEVFEGTVEAPAEVVPEARTLLAWAHELGIPIPADEGTSAESEPETVGPVTLDDAIRSLGTKGFATTANLADALLSTADQIEPLLDHLVVDGLAVTVAGAYRLTDAGKARASDLLEVDRDAWGVGAATAALDTFLELDRRMKDAVTAWQLRPTDGEPVVNDHGDAAYDAEVLDRLSGIGEDADRWLEPLTGASPRLLPYRTRLARAIERGRAGDRRFVASPRVDSFHGVWFELHEDLIQLAGRTRAEEVEAGRA
jgi:pyruvate,orthophosphate dikinase